MGGLIGLMVDLLGAGNIAIYAGAIAGGVVFSVAVPRMGGAS
jgi:hypothetical protein